MLKHEHKAYADCMLMCLWIPTKHPVANYSNTKSARKLALSLLCSWRIYSPSLGSTKFVSCEMSDFQWQCCNIYIYPMV